MSYLDDLANRIRSNIDPQALPANSEALLRSYAVLALALGDKVTDEDVHNAWVSWMSDLDPTHIALVPFGRLDETTAASDRRFRDAIRSVAEELGDPVDRVLFRTESIGDLDRAEFLELYKLMVASSESLVNRRQGVNTFFLTTNGVLLTAIGLFLRGSGRTNLKGAAVLAVALAGLALAYTWWSLLKTFGQLNTGKFAIINRMERRLVASIYEAEWVALDRGENPKVYRSFTSRESIVPTVAMVVYGLVVLGAALVALKLWRF